MAYEMTLTDWTALAELMARSFVILCFCLGFIAGGFR